ncbi:MAG: class I SAM-dependent methyltransferase [Thiotrichaceae bacterium]|nr:class I SAM-dependent methyltransferase [Thiotrichaceae bacterium]
MHRIPEPDLMDDDKQACAYAQADFEAPHSLFIELFQQYFATEPVTGLVLDLGCGAADISRRFAQSYPECQIEGIDGSAAMLKYAAATVEQYQLQQRIHLKQLYLPSSELPASHYDAVICNSLLHHLHNPQTLWQTIKHVAKSRAPIFIMDLLRPESARQAEIMVQQYSGNEPEILRHDFYHSLLAAYNIEEVEAQLQAAGLIRLHLHEVSDRHWVVVGHLRGR